MNFNTITKQQITAAVYFAIDNIPGVDTKTLDRFLELVTVTGQVGLVTQEEIWEKMRLFRKYVPGTCTYSLQVLTILLEARVPVYAVSV